jgi:hypothetical protein
MLAESTFLDLFTVRTFTDGSQVAFDHNGWSASMDNVKVEMASKETELKLALYNKVASAEPSLERIPPAYTTYPHLAYPEVINGAPPCRQRTLVDPLAEDTHLLIDSALSPPSLSVTLYLPKARTLRHLSVKVLDLQDIGWGDHRLIESSIVLDRTVTLHDSLSSPSKADENDDDSTHLKLDKGEHTWEFILVIPSSTPTYERSRWGRVRHRVSAKAKGLGAFGGDLVSEERELFLKIDVGVASSASLMAPRLTLSLALSLRNSLRSTTGLPRQDRREDRHHLAFRYRDSVQAFDSELSLPLQWSSAPQC